MIATEYIKERMKKEGVTYKELAESLTIKERQVRNWVKKPHRLNSVQIQKLCVLLKIKTLVLNELINDSLVNG